MERFFPSGCQLHGTHTPKSKFTNVGVSAIFLGFGCVCVLHLPVVNLHFKRLKLEEQSTETSCNQQIRAAEERNMFNVCVMAPAHPRNSGLLLFPFLVSSCVCVC